MRKKRWNLIFLGLCLALVFSVSSVEAKPCDKCQKCDQNGNQIIRESTFCDKKCDAPLGTEAAFLDDVDIDMCPVDDDGGGVTKFTVEVFFDFGSGFETIGTLISGVVGTSHGNRTKMGENPMTVDIDDLTRPTGPTDCEAMFTGADSASFTFHTARHAGGDDLTFISPGLGAIPGTIDGQAESFALRFDNGAIADPTTVADCDDYASDLATIPVTDWFPGPGETTCFFGNKITWSQNQAPTDAACNGEVVNNGEEVERLWRIGVTGE